MLLQARLVQGGLLKKVLDATKDLVTDANFDCTASGFSLQVLPFGLQLSEKPIPHMVLLSHQSLKDALLISWIQVVQLGM